jgi:DNA-binding IclR family transcriptional regulator
VSFSSLGPNTVKNLDEFMAQLSQARRRGYAVDDEELMDGLACVGAPILNYAGEPVAAISVAYPRYRYAKDSAEKRFIIQNVIDTADKISKELGS